MRAERARAALAGPAVVLGLALAALVAPAPASALSQASGILCTTYHAAAGTATVRYGYSNVDPYESLSETLSAGDHNYFTPPPLERGQAVQLVAGNGSFDLTFAAGATPPVWMINGTADTPDLNVADLPFERPCPERGPSISAVSPAGLAAGAGGDLAVFGQGLAGASVAVSGAGVSVSAPTASTEQRLDATIAVAADAAPGPRDVLVTDPSGNEVGCRGCLTIGPAEEGTGPSEGEGGASATSSVSHRDGSAKRLNRHGMATAIASCPAGSPALAGGYRLAGHGTPAALSVLADRPRGTGGWTVTVRARGAKHPQRLIVSVTCLGG